MVAEEDTVVLSAESDQRRRDAFELLCSAFIRQDVPTQGLQNLKRDGLLNAADIGLGLVSPDDMFGQYL